MIDNRAEVYKILTSVSENVDYRYPLNLADNMYPKICYYTSNKTQKAFLDNKSSMMKIETTVQVYEKTIEGELVEIHDEALEAMTEEGFIIDYFDNYYDTEDKTHIYTMRFSKIYEVKGDNIYE